LRAFFLARSPTRAAGSGLRETRRNASQLCQTQGGRARHVKKTVHVQRDD
jgi:hypothetical protein